MRRESKRWPVSSKVQQEGAAGNSAALSSASRHIKPPEVQPRRSIPYRCPTISGKWVAGGGVRGR